MTRLPRSRKGKTPIDVTITDQNGVKRVRLTVGQDGGAKKNSDLDAQEVADLVTMLVYNVGVITGNIEDSTEQKDEHEQAPGVWFEDDDAVAGALRDAALVHALGVFEKEYSSSYHLLRHSKLEVEFMHAVLSDNAFRAIKVYREATYVDLGSAKDFVAHRLMRDYRYRSYEKRGI